MDLTDGVKVYCKSMGKVFRVRHIAKSEEEANDFCARHSDCGAIAEDKNGLVYIAELYALTIRSDLLPE